MTLLSPPSRVRREDLWPLEALGAVEGVRKVHKPPKALIMRREKIEWLSLLNLYFFIFVNDNQ